MVLKYVPIIAVPFYLILVVIFGIIIFVWFKEDPVIVRKLPIILATLHFVLAIILSIIILVLLKSDGEAGMLWYIFAYLDWPVSFIFMHWLERFWSLIDNLFMMMTIPRQFVINILSPFIIFGIFGTIQYYIWGLVISKIFLFLKK